MMAKVKNVQIQKVKDRYWKKVLRLCHEGSREWIDGIVAICVGDVKKARRFFQS